METSVSSMITSIVMIILFTIALLGFSIGFANDNDASLSIADDDNFSILSMNSSTRGGLGDFSSNTSSTYDSIINTTVEPGSDVIRSPAVFTLTWGSLFSTLGNILTVGYMVLFGGGATFGIFITTFLALIGLLFTLYIIKAWRGNP